MCRSLSLIALMCLLTAVPFAGQAGEWDRAGDVGAELRYFSDEPQWPDQMEGLQASLAVNFTARWKGDNSRASIQPFLRLDSADSERSHFDLREAWWSYRGDGWDVLVGLNKVFWGVTESRHLVDIINQTDLVEDPDQEQKLGQPMLRGLLERDWGQVELYLMPYFRERTFPGAKGRLRAPWVVATDPAIHASSARAHHTDIALRWSHYFGDVDAGLYVFHGTGREPKLLPSAEGRTLAPYYHQITQVGADLQYTRDAWLWKLEAIARKGLDDTFVAAVAGFEYTFYGLNKGASDLGVLFEYLYDGRGSSEPDTVFEDDLFVGARWAMNDMQDSSVLAGVVVDRKTSEWFFSLEAERRIGENLFAETRIRLFNGKVNGQLKAVDQDDYAELKLTRYF